jgi:glycosyltransferase involved in cell wall biosynthesis
VTEPTPQTISVIVPVYDMGRYLPEAIASIEGQGIDDVEIIVVDDGSTDDTPDVIASLGSRVVAVGQENRGPAAARNRGIEIATGEVFAFLDADDLWPQGKLALQLERLARDPDLDVLLGRIRFVALDGGSIPNIEFEDLDAKTLTHVHLGSGVYRRRAFERIGRFDETLRFAEDVDWFLRAREAGLRIAILPDVTLVYRLHGANMTREIAERDEPMLGVLKRSLDRRRTAGIVGDLTHWRTLDDRLPDLPAVSVVIPAFNAAPYLRETIRSALAQTHRPAEIIVVDDGSTDATASIANRFGSRVRVISRDHAGIGAARNAGVRAARGELIAFLDADDVWEPEKLARQVQLLAANPTLDLVFGGVDQFVSPELANVVGQGRNVTSHAGRCATTLLMRAEVAARVGSQREDVSVAEFVDWYARAVAAGCRVGQVDGVVAHRRIHQTNTGSTHRREHGDFARVMKDVLDRRRAAGDGAG